VAVSDGGGGRQEGWAARGPLAPAPKAPEPQERRFPPRSGAAQAACSFLLGMPGKGGSGGETSGGAKARRGQRGVCEVERVARWQAVTVFWVVVVVPRAV